MMRTMESDGSDSSPRGVLTIARVVMVTTAVLWGSFEGVHGFMLPKRNIRATCDDSCIHPIRGKQLFPSTKEEFDDTFSREHVSRTDFLRSLQLAGIATVTCGVLTNDQAIAFDGGVGGLGKTKPQTGVELFDETSAPIQNDKGIVSSEIKGVDGSPILVSFQTPWPLLPTSGALEARDIRSTESAFVQVAPLTGKQLQWKESKKEFSKVLQESVFAAQGKFGAYGQPFDIQIKPVSGSTSETKPSLFSVNFTTLTPAMRESERRALIAAKQVGADTLVLLVVTTTSARYASNEKTFQLVASSFDAIAAPESGLNNKKRTSKD